jgi:proline iminopeptidase
MTTVAMPPAAEELRQHAEAERQYQGTELVGSMPARGRRQRSLRLGLAAGIVAGALVGSVLPRGPITTGQAIDLMLVALLTGAVAARVGRSRWTLLLAPVGFLITWEVARRGIVSGPTIDSFRLDSMYGVLALVLGRLLLVIAAILPMLLGASLVLGVRRLVTIPLGLAVAVLVYATLLPASTPPILAADGNPLPGSIASLETVQLGGHEQSIMLRGNSTSNPVLLYPSGGPGQSGLPYVRVLFNNLEQDFVVVGWDQRGTGKSYPALDPRETLTLDQAVSDTVDLAEYLRTRFDQPKIYVLGESWGSTLGVLAAQRRPDLFYAVIGSGQMVSQLETDRRLYHDVLDLAARTGDAGLAQTMRGYGEPPYGDVFASAFVMQQYDALYKPYTPPESLQELGAAHAAEIGPWGVLGREYNLVEKVSVMRGLMDMFATMYPQLQNVDFRRDAPRLEVPYYMLDGAAELTARRDLALEWHAQLDAPRKRIFTFENSAHAVAQEQFVAFRQILSDVIVPEAATTDR